MTDDKFIWIFPEKPYFFPMAQARWWACVAEEEFAFEETPAHTIPFRSGCFDFFGSVSITGPAEDEA